MATAYFAGCKRFIQNFPGATQKDLLGVSGVAILASGILRHENNRKSALVATSISLGTALILKTLHTSIKWESSTFLKVGAVQAFIFGGCFTQKKAYDKNGKLRYDGEWQDGKWHGEGKEYHRNGNLLYKGEWQYGWYHGQGKSYHKNNKIQYEGEWQHNTLYRKVKDYDNDERVIYEDKYQDGSRVS